MFTAVNVCKLGMVLYWKSSIRNLNQLWPTQLFQTFDLIGHDLRVLFDGGLFFSGVLLHYDDPLLRDLYFLDPQWLCDMLAHVVTIREVNPHMNNGTMN